MVAVGHFVDEPQEGVEALFAVGDEVQQVVEHCLPHSLGSKPTIVHTSMSRMCMLASVATNNYAGKNTSLDRVNLTI